MKKRFFIVTGVFLFFSGAHAMYEPDTRCYDFWGSLKKCAELAVSCVVAQELVEPMLAVGSIFEEYSNHKKIVFEACDATYRRRLSPSEQKDGAVKRAAFACLAKWMTDVRVLVHEPKKTAVVVPACTYGEMVIHPGGEVILKKRV